jgi:hypothetical protein
VSVPAPSAAAPAPCTVLGPDEVRRLVPAVGLDLWVYRYVDTGTGWRLSVATHAAPGSGHLSLGGFRIAPESRTARPDFDADREAVGLAAGMEEKVEWSRVLGVGGPLAAGHLTGIVGGKCVLVPTPDARVGQPADAALLDWAVACLGDCEARAGIHIVTGQDLGHGRMSGGASSLAYMHERFAGSMLADTSRPTGEGNVQLLCGMLAGAGIDPAGARVLLVGAGNVGRTLLGRLRETGAAVGVVEAVPATRSALAAAGVPTWAPEERLEAMAGAWDAVAVNAAGGSLDPAACAVLAANAAVRVVCGSENLAMPDPAGEQTLLAARTLYAPTELGGMMGYLTAVEEYLARRAGVPFAVEPLVAAAARLRTVGEAAARRVVAGGFAERFADAVRAVGRG